MPRAKPPPGSRRSRPDPNIRVQPDGRGAFVDGIDSYQRELVGAPPADFSELLKLAHALLPMAAEVCGIDPHAPELPPEDVNRDLTRLSDTLLLAAWLVRASKNDGEGENPIAFVQRCKQVIGWCDPPREGVTLLEVIERKGREITRLVGERLSSWENFMLVVCDSSTDGHMTWLTSVPRNQAIELFGAALERIRIDQRAHS